MDTTIIKKLVLARQKLKGQIEAQEAALTEQLAPDKIKLKRIEEKLATMINKSGAEGTMESVKVGGFIAYASETAKYSVAPDGRQSLEDWVMAPRKKADIKERLQIFGNTLKKEAIQEYRTQTGAEETDGQLKGGKLPEGVRLHIEKKANFRKAQ